jgi:hypothetical protein
MTRWTCRRSCGGDFAGAAVWLVAAWFVAVWFVAMILSDPLSSVWAQGVFLLGGRLRQLGLPVGAVGLRVVALLTATLWVVAVRAARLRCVLPLGALPPDPRQSDRGRAPHVG